MKARIPKSNPITIDEEVIANAVHNEMVKQEDAANMRSQLITLIAAYNVGISSDILIEIQKERANVAKAFSNYATDAACDAALRNAANTIGLNADDLDFSL